MKKIYKTRTNCRLCGSNSLELVVPLGNSPVSEKYLTKDNLSKKQQKVPLDLYFCLSCTHVQLLTIVEPAYLWSDYTFRTANNPALIDHFKDIAKRILSYHPCESDSLIVDIGSNDGTLLKCFIDVGYKNILGVDPADVIAAEAVNNGITTINDFMNIETSNSILKEYGKASIVTANNVYAHVDDFSGLTNSIKNILKKDGIFVFEVSYLLDIVDKMLIGTIFHEHLCYHSVTAMSKFLDHHDLELINVERGPEQGGSFIGYAQFKNGPKPINSNVKKLINLENRFGLNKPETIRQMYNNLESVKRELTHLLSNLRNEGKSIAGFGAARAGTTLLSYFNIGNLLEFLVDDNKNKHYKFSPGDNLEVFPTSYIYKKKPDYLLILAWLHTDTIVKSHSEFMKHGRAFISLFPGINIINS